MNTFTSKAKLETTLTTKYDAVEAHNIVSCGVAVLRYYTEGLRGQLMHVATWDSSSNQGWAA